MEIYIHMGMASRAGIISFDLAAAGMQSSETVLEGRDGLFEAYGAGAEGSGIFARSFDDTEVGTGIMGVCFKPVAGCNMIETPLVVALEVGRKMGKSTGEIEDVLVTTTTHSRDIRVATTRARLIASSRRR
jgi:2-methylcitrate dehydratase PrpD